MRVGPPRAAKLTQGSIFSCVANPMYQGCKCYGLVITRRCHLEHNNYDVINYVPVVQYKDWVERDMTSLLAKRIVGSIRSQIRDRLSGIPSIDMLLKTFPLEDVVDRETTGGKRDELRNLVRCQRAAEEAVRLRGRFVPENSILREYGKNAAKTLAKELIKSQISDYYYLHQVDGCAGSGEGFVALLRHVRTLPAQYGSMIADGIETTNDKLVEEIKQHLTFDYESICLVLGELRSPFIEHLLQHFTRLWDDIGLEDYEDKIIKHAEQLAAGV
jgi:hypothetical protein